MDSMLNDSEFMGYVNYVNPKYVQISLPSYKIRDNSKQKGARIGDYVMIEGIKNRYLSKILEINIDERHHRPKASIDVEGAVLQLELKVEVLLGFKEDSILEPKRGIASFPCIGDKAFFADKWFVEGFFKSFGLKHNHGYEHISLGKSTDYLELPIKVSMQSLLSRHCAIVGTTGSGKSWTIARIIGEMKEKESTKIILIDPTGEFKSIEDETFESVSIAKDAFFHYRNLTIEDLYYLIKPSDSVQMPKLLEAIRSLKALELDYTDELYEYRYKGIIRKASRKKEAFEAFYFKNISKIENGMLNFNIKYLSAQITQECIFDTDKNHPEKYGIRNEEAVSKCFNLISRTSNLLHTDIFQEAFGFDKDESSSREMTRVINAFLASDKKVLRIGFEDIGFEFQAREIIANAIGKFLLDKARKGVFKKSPITLFVDEAHQFVNKKVVDDYFQGVTLSAFDHIAKECRKYGIFLCMSTQMPRDIPNGTLSQMGTFIVHRLINQNDKNAILEACSSATGNTLDLLPVLGEGEAILTGVDFPMDATIKMNPPILKPDSGTPVLGKKIIEDLEMSHI